MSISGKRHLETCYMYQVATHCNLLYVVPAFPLLHFAFILQDFFAVLFITHTKKCHQMLVKFEQLCWLQWWLLEMWCPWSRAGSLDLMHPCLHPLTPSLPKSAVYHWDWTSILKKAYRKAENRVSTFAVNSLKKLNLGILYPSYTAIDFGETLFWKVLSLLYQGGKIK